MEVNIHFCTRNSDFASIVKHMSLIMSELAVLESKDELDCGFNSIELNGECIGTVEMLPEPGDNEDYYPYNCHDLSDDADALASAGFGTDEDYGYYGDYD
ncbi:MAG: hypothetical protein EBT51_09430 [Flavobacteriaceae bacterium]|nr:hypothetical protein [Flavobacteriaceae bacterium]